MKKFIEKLQYISHDDAIISHIAQAQMACEAGAKWIQYRCLSKSDEQLVQEINVITEICDDWGATLIVTDHIHLKNKIDVQGFHIEDLHADFSAIRLEIGENYTLGSSATNLHQVQALLNKPVDYIGFGPFSTSLTKPNDYPLIGVQGYQTLMEKLGQNHIPILAVGGISLQDVESLSQTGIFGVAVSAAILGAQDFKSAYSDFYNLIS